MAGDRGKTYSRYSSKNPIQEKRVFTREVNFTTQQKPWIHCTLETNI